MRYLFLTLATCLRALPVSVLVLLGRFLGWLLRCVFRFRVRVVRHQLELAFPERTPAEIGTLLKEVYRHLGLLGIELVSLPKVPYPRVQRLVKILGQEHMQEALAAGKGALILTGHVADWEIAGVALAAAGLPIRAIGKEMKNASGDLLRHLLRDGNGIPTIPRKNSIKQIFRELKENHIVVVLLDQNMTADEGVFVEFFGHPACTMKALAVLAARTGAAVIPTRIQRLPDRRRHEVEFLPPIAYEALAGADQEEEYRHNTQRYTLALEELIRRQPDQWMWIHKRWRTRPPDETSSPFRY